MVISINITIYFSINNSSFVFDPHMACTVLMRFSSVASEGG